MSNPIFNYARLTYIPFGVALDEANFIPFEFEDKVLGVTIDLEENVIPKMSLQLKNHDLQMFNHPLIEHQAIVGIRLFRTGFDPSIRFVGYVERINGNWELSIDFTDLVFKGHFVNSASKKKIQTDGKSRKEIVSELITRLGFKTFQIELGEISEEKKSEGIALDGSESIWTLLNNLADEEKASIIITGREKFFFGKRPLESQPVAIFKVEPAAQSSETEVLDWNIDDDYLGHPAEVEVNGLNLRKKKVIKEKADGDSATRTTLAPQTNNSKPDAEGRPPKSVAERTEDETKTGVAIRRGTSLSFILPKDSGKTKQKRSAVQTEAGAKDEAEAEFREQEEEQIRMQLVTRFRPDMLPGIIIEVLNIGKAYSGKWYVAKVSHELKASATTTMELLKNGRNDVPGVIKRPSGDVAKLNTTEPKDDKELKRKTSVRVSGETGTVFVR